MAIPNFMFQKLEGGKGTQKYKRIDLDGWNSYAITVVQGKVFMAKILRYGSEDDFDLGRLIEIDGFFTAFKEEYQDLIRSMKFDYMKQKEICGDDTDYPMTAL